MIIKGILFGLLSGGLMAMLLLAAHFIFGYENTQDLARYEQAGYLGLILALLVIVAGIHFYRIKNWGQRGFVYYLAMGSVITVTAAAVMGGYTAVYHTLNPEFTEIYYNSSEQVELIKNDPDLTAGQKKLALEKLEEQNAVFKSTWLQVVVMMGQIMIIGLLITFFTSLGFWWVDNRPGKGHVEKI